VTIRRTRPTWPAAWWPGLLLLGLGLALGQAASPARAGGFTVDREVVSLEVRRSGHYTETVERTVRIDTPAGIEAQAQSWLSFSADRSSLEVLEAWVESPAGERRAVPRSRILLRERSEDDRLDLLGRVRSRVVVFPRVEVGSRLHLHWRAEHAPVFPGHFVWQRHAAATGVPGQWVVRLSHEPGLPLRVHRLGLAGGELVADARGWRRHEYRLAGAEPARGQDQRRAPPADAQAAVLALSTFASWAELAHRYRDFAAPMATVTPAIRAHAQELTRGARSTPERVRRLHDWVRRHVRYVALTSERGGWSPFPAEQVLHTRDGDCKDQSALLQALLAAVGIGAEAVLIDAGLGEMPPLPNHFLFSHMMVYVPETGQYLDPANGEAAGVLAREYEDRLALHIGSGRLGRTPVGDPKREGSQAAVNMVMLEDGSVDGSSFTYVRGPELRDLRRDLADDAGSGRFVGRVLAHRGEWGTGRADVVSGADDPALVVKMSFELEPLADLSGPTLLRLPRGASASLLRRYTLPLDPEEQTCRGEVHTETIRLTLPAGRAVEGRLPQGISFRRGALSYRSHYEASREDGRVQLAVVRELEVRCTAPRLGADDLAHREALRAVLRKDLWAHVTLR
jgi:transglutaminase-like putative cysteine protease